jgi:hypothetical protein
MANVDEMLRGALDGVTVIPVAAARGGGGVAATRSRPEAVASACPRLPWART